MENGNDTTIDGDIVLAAVAVFFYCFPFNYFSNSQNAIFIRL